MVRLIIITLLLLPMLSNLVSAESGPQVPIFQSTQNKYCSNGTCQTSPVTNIQNQTKEIFSKYPIIMIIPSELCTTALKHNLKTNCPPLQNLTKYDNSNQKISGYFYSPDGKRLDRSNPQVKNHWMYYGYSNHTIICVYCTGNYLTTDLYKTIIIEPDNFEYVPKTFVNVNVKNEDLNITTSQNEIVSGLTSYLNREVRGCNTATISYSDAMLKDTIKYLESGCTVTNLTKTKTQQVHNTPWVYNNPYSSLHYKAVVDQVKSKHPGYCIDGNCSYTTSTKKAGW